MGWERVSGWRRKWVDGWVGRQVRIPLFQWGSHWGSGEGVSGVGRGWMGRGGNGWGRWLRITIYDSRK